MRSRQLTNHDQLASRCCTYVLTLTRSRPTPSAAITVPDLTPSGSGTLTDRDAFFMMISTDQRVRRSGPTQQSWQRSYLQFGSPERSQLSERSYRRNAISAIRASFQRTYLERGWLMDSPTRRTAPRDHGSAAVSAIPHQASQTFGRLPSRGIAVTAILALIEITAGLAPISATTLDVAAFQATSPVATPAPVDPAECRMAPRPADDVAALAGAPPGFHLTAMRSMMLGTPIASPTPPAGGVPADPAVVTAVTATLRELAACINAGDLQRAASLFTDRAFLWVFRGAEEDLSQEEIAEYLASIATPTPLPPDRRASLTGDVDVQVLTDGRIVAVSQGFGGEAVAFFAEENGRYLIDTGFALPPAATPTP